MFRIAKIAVIVLLTTLVSCEGDRNFHNLQTVRKGMSIAQVYNIMGKPKVVTNDIVLANANNRELFQLVYEPPFASSDNIYIHITTNDSTVFYINDGQR